MLCHCMACFWIFTSELSIDPVVDADGALVVPEDGEVQTNWILSNGFEDQEIAELYTTAFYFTVTTITTVGYGDISGTNTTERVICIFLMIIGVLFFSFSSGSLTQIISNYEKVNLKLQEKQEVLNKIYKEYSIPSQLYYEILTAIKFDTSKDL